jgi:PST family polysaccharide transporter
VNEGAPPASLVENSTWLLIARTAALVASAAVTVIAVRTLTTPEYGRFAFVITLVTLAVSLSELGINALATRQMVEDPQSARRILGIALGAEIATSVVAAVCLFIAAIAFQRDARTLALIPIACVVVLLQGAIAAFDAPFQARRLLRPVASFGLIQSAVLLGVGTTVLLVGFGAPGLMAATAVANGAAAAAAFHRLRRLQIGPAYPLAGRDPGAFVRSVRAFIRSAALIAVTGTFATIYERIDVLLVSHYRGPRGVAFYSAALSIVVTLYVIPAAISTAYYPLLTAQMARAREAARESFALLFRVFILVSVPLAILLGFAAPTLVRIAFGPRYQLSGVVLQILSPILVLSFVNYICWQALLAAHREGGKAAIVAVALVLNVALNLALIPAHGVRGAAYSLLATETLVAVVQAVVVHRQVFPLQLRRLFAAPLVAGAIAAAAVVAVPLGPDVLQGALASAIYVATLLVLRYVSAEEWRPVTQPLRALTARART